MLDLPDDPAPPRPEGAVLDKIVARRRKLRDRRRRRRLLTALAAGAGALFVVGSQLRDERVEVEVAAAAPCGGRNPGVTVIAGETLRATVLPDGFELTEGSETDPVGVPALRYSSTASKDRWILLSRQQRNLQPPALPGMLVGSVHGQPAVISDSAISWQATDTVVITVSASGLGTDELLRVADGVAYETGVSKTLTDADLAPRSNLGGLERFYRQQLGGTIERLQLRQMFVADLTAAAASAPTDIPLPIWIGRPSDTVVVLIATGDLRARLPGTPGTATGRAAFAYVTDAGPAAGLGLLDTLPENLKNLPDRVQPASPCQTTSSSLISATRATN